ncbi:hypothetical protein [Rhodococcus artemisiae]|uniref:LPXTG-motif cell wall-anchored protein n=1 Tax=Rhodococcus artemisiae TaxID=714159 RepID=A0ABU7LA83_9NOCA|nr:hypothetical protein [Rhodococcus artemisiae]MEE2057792.1 hypothetical protein [Rhodococcus artemisiae]
MSTMTEVRTENRWTNVMQALWTGVGLQVVCIVLPLLDLWVFGSIGRNVESAYPEWGAGDVQLDRNAIVAYLVAVGGLGLAGWLGALWCAKRDRWVRASVTTLFIIGMSVLAFDAGVSGEAYDRIVPLWLGSALLIIPLFPGVTALLAAWVKAPRR